MISAVHATETTSQVSTFPFPSQGPNRGQSGYMPLPPRGAPGGHGGREGGGKVPTADFVLIHLYSYEKSLYFYLGQQ